MHTLNDVEKVIGRNVKDLAAEGVKLNLYQVEPTNVCNGGCWYCPQPTMDRERGFMDAETYAAVLKVQAAPSFHLHGYSEPLLHDDIVQMVQQATDAGFRVGFSTNGSEMTQETLDALYVAGLAWLRLHVGPFGVRLADFTLPADLEATEHRVGDQGPDDAPEKGMTSFAGFVDEVEESGGFGRCSFLGYPNGKTWQCVLWDGTVTMCCVDFEGGGQPGNDKLCKSCRGFVFRGAEDWGNYDGEGFFPETEGK